jgi:O-methyltransferase involved in polyketide biosynthesis
VVQRHPHLQATVLDLPLVAEMARSRVEDRRLADRIDVVAADAMAEELPGGHDVFLVANLIHYWSPETNVALLTRIRSAAPPGARLLLADFWTDPTHTEPLQAALMAGEFAVHLRDGDVYSVDEARDWLTDSGWRFVDHTPLAGPQSLIIADAN